MKQLYRFWDQHKHLFIVSLLSGLTVFGLQLAMQKISDTEKEQMQNVKLQSVSVAVITTNKQTAPSQVIVEMNQRQRSFFNSVGWVKDTSIVENTGQAFMFESLTASLGRDSREFVSQIKLADTPLEVSLCQDTENSPFSCRKYGTNKLGSTLPVDVAYAPWRVNTARITLSIPEGFVHNEGTFSLPQPVLLDITPI